MPPKKGAPLPKGTAPSKGKQPARRRPVKRPMPAMSPAEEEELAKSRQEILDKMAAWEQARGITGSPAGGTRGKRASHGSSALAFQREILNRLPGLIGPSTAGQQELVTAQLPMEVAVGPGGEAEQEWPAEEVQDWPTEEAPVALAVEPWEEDGAVARRGSCRILICGHSMVFWAAHQAKRTPIGSQLGFSRWASVKWQGRRGLRWQGLLPLLFQGRKEPPPNFLVIHLGGNDLRLIKGKALSLQAHEDLQEISSRWPGVTIFWSAILPRKVWRAAHDPKGVERARRKANKAMQKALGKGLGIYLPHPRIRTDAADLYRADGVHLSVLGNEIFLTDLQQGLCLALCHLWGARPKAEA